MQRMCILHEEYKPYIKGIGKFKNIRRIYERTN